LKSAQYARLGKEGGVDISVWLGLVLFLLSIPMGVAINMLTPRFVAYLEKRKLIKSNRTKRAGYSGIQSHRSVQKWQP
jgi:hypothetical protein